MSSKKFPPKTQRCLKSATTKNFPKKKFHLDKQKSSSTSWSQSRESSPWKCPARKTGEQPSVRNEHSTENRGTRSFLNNPNILLSGKD